MVSGVNRLKANRLVHGKACVWCSRPLSFGEDACVCDGCSSANHAACWDTRGGCATEGCVNAPLKQLDLPPAAATEIDSEPLPHGKMLCPHCQLILNRGTMTCQYCRKSVSAPTVPAAGGQVHGPGQNAPGATASLIFGIVGLFFCGFIFGVLAIQRADEAKAAIAVNPSLMGEGMATAGKILGIIALVFWGLGLLVQVFIAGS